MNMFDKIITFDMIDSKELNIEYLPLFYTNNYANLELSKEKVYDISFFGSYHSDRLEIIKKLEKECKEKGLTFYHYLYSPKLALFRKILNSSVKIEDLKYFKTSPATNQELLDIYKKSKAVLDIESSIQNGLTIRTFEVLGAKLKLISTNKNIIDEDFYNKNNIYILDRNNITLDKEFFD
jgi:spore maturation protein CgeB